MTAADFASKSSSPTSPRDRHLFAPGPKRILSIDGGGARGVLAIGILKAIEAALARRHGRPIRLCDYFDLVGGTSTGAIIAAGLALGFSTVDLLEFYQRLVPRVFRRSFWRVAGIQSKFDGRRLKAELDVILGARTLDTPDLLTGLAIIMKRLDTASPWIVANNPRARYWDSPPDRSFIGNRHFALAALVRASTAAPHFFQPELIDVSEGGRPGLFVDGGVTPHNNPALQLFLLAVLEGHRLAWPQGGDRLLLVSIGTGQSRQPLTVESVRRMPAIGLAAHALTGLIGDMQVLSTVLLHWLSGSPAQWDVNSEIGRVGGGPPLGSALLTFRRYDAQLEAAWLAAELGVAVDATELRRLQPMDRSDAMERLYEIGTRVGEKFVADGDFPPAFDLPA